VLSPDEVRDRYRRLQDEVGPEVTIVAATKYVSLPEMAVLAAAGVTVVGENRAQDLEAKHAQYGDTFRWHFIGRLQSNKVKVVNRICELVHSLDTESAARRLEIPALVQVNLAGEGSKGGVPPEEVETYLGYDVLGLSTMPPAAPTPEASRPWFAALRRLASMHGLAELSMGTTQDYAVAAEEGATHVRVGSALFRV
jgi:PLP dependent protein